MSDEQWALVEPLIPVSPGGRPRKPSLRDVVDALFSLVRAGRQWRSLPTDFPPRSTGRGSFDEWRHTGLIEVIHDALREQVRTPEGRERTPSAGSTDSQAAPATAGGAARGDDAPKQGKGRQRHLVVDTLGLRLAVAVTAASADDGAAAPLALGQLTRDGFPRLRLLWADAKSHNHARSARLAESAHVGRAIVSRPPGGRGFVRLPRRWVVERTFAWRKRCRRLSLDREASVRSAEAMIRLARIHRMLNRLCPTGEEQEFRYRMAA